MRYRLSEPSGCGRACAAVDRPEGHRARYQFEHARLRPAHEGKGRVHEAVAVNRRRAGGSACHRWLWNARRNMHSAKFTSPCMHDDHLIPLAPFDRCGGAQRPRLAFEVGFDVVDHVSSDPLWHPSLRETYDDFDAYSS